MPWQPWLPWFFKSFFSVATFLFFTFQLFNPCNLVVMNCCTVVLFYSFTILLLYSWTVGARVLKLWENVHHHHLSHFIYQTSHVTCMVSGVMCQFVFLLLFFLQIGGASCWRCCYERGLSRLFFLLTQCFINLSHFHALKNILSKIERA